jgi:hypothetical protein
MSHTPFYVDGHAVKALGQIYCVADNPEAAARDAARATRAATCDAQNKWLTREALKIIRKKA